MIESGTCGPRTPNQRDHLAAPDSHPDSLRAKLRNIRGFVTARMQNLRTIRNSDIAHVRAELAKHIEQDVTNPFYRRLRYGKHFVWRQIALACPHRPSTLIGKCTQLSRLSRAGGRILSE